MSKVEYHHAKNLHKTFYELVDAGILDYKDEDQPLLDILQKLLKSEKELNTQLRYSLSLLFLN